MGAIKILAAAGLLLVVTVISGRPFVFTDTVAYYRLGEQVAATAGLVSAPAAPQASEAVVTSAGQAPATGATTATEDSERLAYTVAGARSPYWSFFLFGTILAATAWLTVVMQAVLLAWSLYVLFRVLAAERAYLPSMLVLAFASSLPFFVGFLMPDVLAGAAIVAVVCVMLFWGKLSRAERIGMWLAMAFSLAAHTSHSLIAITLIAVGLVVLAILHTPVRQMAVRAVLVGTAIALAVGGSAAYGAAVKLIKGEELRSPPMITARLMADGPGQAYLRKACSEGEPYALCAFVGQPVANHNDFLWSEDPARGLFQLADYDTRVGIIDEQFRFAAGVLGFDPLGVIGAALKNWGLQIVTFDLFEAINDPTRILKDPAFTRMHDILPGGRTCVADQSCAPRISVSFFNAVQTGLVAISILLLPMLVMRLEPERRSQAVAVIALVVIALIVNAAICGMLSGVQARYQSRIIWLVPALALLTAAMGFAHHRRDLPGKSL